MFGAVSAKSLIIIVEMRTDSPLGNRVEIRITYSNVAWSLVVLIINKNYYFTRLVRAYIH